MDLDLPVSTHHIRLSLFPVSIRIIGGTFLVEGLYAVLLAGALAVDPSQGYTTEILVGLLVLQVLKFGVLAALVLRVLLEWATTTYYVQEDHLVRRSGIVRFEEDVYDLRGIRFVNVEEHWLSKMLNYGNVSLSFGSAGYREQVILKGISSPKKYEQLFRSYLKTDTHDYSQKNEEIPFKPPQ